MKKEDSRGGMSNIVVSVALGGFVTLGAITLMEPVSIDHDFIVWIAAILGCLSSSLLIVLTRKMKKRDA